jgi:hypothetical protein
VAVFLEHPHQEQGRGRFARAADRQIADADDRAVKLDDAPARVKPAVAAGDDRAVHRFGECAQR